LLAGTRVGPLFPAEFPAGFRYEADVIDAADEAGLAARIEAVEFSSFEMRGVVARRRVAFFGAAYDASRPAAPMPDFLIALRVRLAAWAGLDAAALAMALINQYPPGAPIGWHRDAPQYDVVVGLSLLSACRMKLRPYVSPGGVQPGAPPRRTTHEIELAPRSAYVIAGEARSAYEHSIPAVDRLRYSITFRTLRQPRASSASP
jgi:hypothetical protein